MEVNTDHNDVVESDADSHVLVELKPFVHQVGGHTCVLEVDGRTICKPYVQREVWFYENAPSEMKEFIPQYYGTIDVKYDVIRGNRRLVACIPKGLMKDQELLGTSMSRGDVIVKQSSKRGRKRSHEFLEITNQQTETDCSNPEKESMLNQWSMKCLERQISRYGFWANNQPQKFIMLGNLVSGYTHPCMMDLKLGKRQYGDDSSEEKRKLLEKRCAKSTSCSLGLRICGTQVYRHDSHNYVIHDKYHGRYLDTDGVSKEIRFFFHNGFHLRKDVIELIVEKLKKLRNLLLTEQKLNLYSCSLLLLYDGSIQRDGSRTMSHLAEIEHYQKTTDTKVTELYSKSNRISECSVSENHIVDETGPKTKSETGTNFIGANNNENKLGIQTSAISTNLASKSHTAIEVDSAINEVYAIQTGTVQVPTTLASDKTQSYLDAMPNANVEFDKGNPGVACDSTKFDVRLIDFAHVSEKNDNELMCQDPDDSIAFGLTKLIDILQSMLHT